MTKQGTWRCDIRIFWQTKSFGPLGPKQITREIRESELTKIASTRSTERHRQS
jgi:hypothetical protein